MKNRHKNADNLGMVLDMNQCNYVYVYNMHMYNLNYKYNPKIRD